MNDAVLERVRILNYDHHRRMTEDHNRLKAEGKIEGRVNLDDKAYRDMLANVPKVHRILELGSSSGGQWKVLSEWLDEGGSITGIDLFEPAVLESQKNGLDIHLGYVEELPFADETFDLVCSRHVMEHLGDLTRGFAQIMRVMKRGGWFAAATPHYWPDVEPAHINQFHVKQWSGLYGQHGFDVVSAVVYRRNPDEAGSEEGHVICRRP